MASLAHCIIDICIFLLCKRFIGFLMLFQGKIDDPSQAKDQADRDDKLNGLREEDAEAERRKKEEADYVALRDALIERERELTAIHFYNMKILKSKTRFQRRRAAGQRGVN